jgi:hypothetical protein
LGPVSLAGTRGDPKPLPRAAEGAAEGEASARSVLKPPVDPGPSNVILSPPPNNYQATTAAGRAGG